MPPSIVSPRSCVPSGIGGADRPAGLAGRSGRRGARSRRPSRRSSCRGSRGGRRRGRRCRRGRRARSRPGRSSCRPGRRSGGLDPGRAEPVGLGRRLRRRLVGRAGRDVRAALGDGRLGRVDDATRHAAERPAAAAARGDERDGGEQRRRGRGWAMAVMVGASECAVHRPSALVVAASRRHRRRVTIGSRAGRARSRGRRRRGCGRGAGRRAAPRAPPRSPGPGRSRRAGDGSAMKNRSKIRLEAIRRDAGAAIGDGDPDLGPRSRRRRTTTSAPGACSRALSRRLPRIRSSRRGSVSMTTRSSGSSRTASRMAGRRDVADQPAEIDRLDPDLLARGVEPRQLHQVLDEGAQPADVVDDELAGPARVRRQGVEVVAQDRRLGDERGDRRPQLVGDVGDEPPVLGLGGLEPDDRVLERVGHPVEPIGPRARTRRSR